MAQSLRATNDSLLDPLVLFEAVRNTDGEVVDFVYRELNQATCDYLSTQREELLDKGLLQTTPGIAEAGLFDRYVRCLATGEPVIANNLTYVNEWLGDTRSYDVRATRVSCDLLTLTWRDVTERFHAEQLLAQAREQRTRADVRYRRLMDTSQIGMGLFPPDGRFLDFNQAMCDFFGYDAATLRTKTWQELTAPDYLEADAAQADAILAGRIDSYRMKKQYIHANGHLIWGDLSVSCLRAADGEVENFVVQIIDITQSIEAMRLIEERNETNRQLAQRLKVQTDRLLAELSSATAYVKSILPGDLEGPVRVTSRYLPSQALAGDCFDYRWIDDDHLLIYLADVSGHGVGPALLSVSVHNMMRSGALALNTLLNPDEVLTELNALFQMEQHGGNYITMWCAVYEHSTRTVRFANAGAPPALILGPEACATPTALSTPGLPLGMFADSTYDSHTFDVPPGSHGLLFSDGAYESGQTEHGRLMSLADFTDLVCAHAGGSTLDDLTAELLHRTATGTFDDDCSLVQLEFD